jgi:DNA topoisomerase-2
MILVNGSEGIGTGFSTNIPPYNPTDLIANIKDYLNGKSVEKLNELTPWYFGFVGKIEKENPTTYISHGVFEQIDEYTIKITELPIGVWIQNYIDFLSGLIDKDDMISDYENNCTTIKINFKLTFKNSELQKLIKSDSIEKKLKLTSTIKISNMHTYKNDEIHKYSNPNQMLKDYIDTRLQIYTKRKEYWIKVLENELKLLKYRRKFIKQVISNELVISKKQKSVLTQELEELEYPELSTNINTKPSYDYLVGMQMWSLTQEKIDELESAYNEKKNDLELYKNTTIQNLWIKELDEFEKMYTTHFENWQKDYYNVVEKKKIIKKNKSPISVETNEKKYTKSNK